MSEASKAASLLNRVKVRLRTEAFARAAYVWSLVILGTCLLAVLAIRLLGALPPAQQKPVWLLTIPALIAVCAGLFHRKVRQEAAAVAVDRHANTKDLFLTFSSLKTSAGEYQPLVAESAEKQADRIVPVDVVPYRFGRQLVHVVVAAGLLGLAILVTPQLDPFGTVEASLKEEKQKSEIAAIRKATEDRTEQLKKSSQRSEERSAEIESELKQLQTAFRQMKPRESQSNTKVLKNQREGLSEQWKAVSNDQLRKLLNQPISEQQLGGSRNAQMNEWLKELKEGKTEGLQKQLDKAQQTMQAMMEAKDPEERKKLESQLKRELQDLEKFSKDKAGSKELTSALNKALKALQAASDPNQPGEKLSEEAMEALKESLKLSEQEMEQVARSAKDLKKLEQALKTLQQAEKLNAKEQLDGAKCEGCETMEDYAELYAQMMGEGQGEGDKDINDGSDGGVGRGGETPEDDSDPEGYKSEKAKTQVKAGKVLLSIKTKEYAEETDFDPDALRKYQEGVQSLKDGVQAAIENEEIPPGYVDGIKSYFDKIESVDPKLTAPSDTE
ncbi:MAG: hypothetical protein R3C19_01240 [Planctomycetaceae bacterium]